MDQQNEPGKVGWRAAPADLAQLFEAIASALLEVEMRKMFGCTCALVHGHMFAGLHERGVFMRLSDEDRAAVEAQLGAAPFEPMPGRRSHTYVMVSPELVNRPVELVPWLEKARAHTSALPRAVAKRSATGDRERRR